jgi:two-component system, OmpR family, sensor histidine kinase BaeS
MRQSLGWKLTLAMVLVSLLGLLTTLWFGQTLSTNAFNQAVYQQRSSGFLKLLTDHYSRTGSWDGLENIIPRQGAPLPEDQARDAAMPPARQTGDTPFSLTDPNGTVIVAGKPFKPRETINLNSYTKTPVEIAGRVVGWVIETPTEGSKTVYQISFQKSLQYTVWLTAIVAIASAILIGVLVSRILTKPLKVLTDGTRALASGQLGHQVKLETTDELGVLANAFNQMSSKLEQADKQRKQLTADIAHDLGTPLTVVSGYVQGMQSGKLKATPERLDTMQDELKLLRNLIEDLRLLSLADAGELRLSKNKLQPAQLLEASRNAFINDAESKGIKLTLEVPEHLPEIDADFERMRLVLGNIISNALRHTPNGGSVTISASQLEKQLLLEVNDTGVGIAQEQLPFIFERFYRADQHRSAEYGGTGLGLAIAKSIVELHGGAIQASSWLGHGTSVQIALQTS